MTSVCIAISGYEVSKVFHFIKSLQCGSKVRYLDEESVPFDENALK